MADNKTSIVIAAQDLASGVIGKIGGELGSLGRAASTLAPSLAGLTGALSVGGMAAYMKAAIDTADGLNDLSQQIGVSVRDLAGWELAANQSGISLESVGKGVKGLGNYIVEHGDQLRKYSIDTSNASAALVGLADIFAAMPDGMEKTALATKLFGKAGMEMIPMLNMGSAGLQEAMDKAKAYGEKMAELAPKADQFNDQLEELSLQAKAAGLNLTSYLMPGLVGFSQWLNDAAAGGERAERALRFLLESDSPLMRNLAKAHVFLSGGAKTDNWALAGMDKATGRKLGTDATTISWADFDTQTAAYLAERQAKAKGKALLGVDGAGGGRSGKEKANPYAGLYGFDDNRSASEIMRELHAEDATLEALRKKYADMADPLQKYRDQLVEIQSLREKGVLTSGQALEAEWRVNEQMTEAARKMDDLGKSTKDANSFAKDFGLTFTSAFENILVKGGDVRDMLAAIGEDIARMVVRKKVTEPLGNAVSGLLDGFDFGSLLGFATGGSFTVGGSGGTDSQLVAFRATPGEDVSIRTPAQQAAARAGGDTYYIDARGADQSAIARLEAMIRSINGSIERRAVGAVNAALNSRGRPGVA